MSGRGHADGSLRVSVVLPIFNRRAFLPAAFEAIASQAMGSLEVIVVDDGSTDASLEVVDQLKGRSPFDVVYIAQQNAGAYGARNTGIRAARGEYIAFYDSDDVWLPHHLSRCVTALDANADVDWVYSASEIVDLLTGRTLDPHCFYEAGSPRPFMRLRYERRGDLRVITDAGAIKCQIDHGLFCGLQNSVFRRGVFRELSLEAATRNEAEDQVFAIRALAAGVRLAYFDAVHVRYHVHADNSSAPGTTMSLEKRRRVYEPLILGYQRLQDEVPLSADERRALRRRVGHDLFWHLGYNGYWAAGHRREALGVYRRALGWWPWDPSCWKTFALALLRTTVASTASPPPAEGR